MTDVDVLVVGAGPAGSSAARVLAEGGAKVLLVDRRVRIGEPVQCAEHVAKIAAKDFEVPPRAVVQSCEAMEVWIDGYLVEGIRAPGYILDRSVFDTSLAEDALQAGARIAVQTKVLSREGDEVLARRGDKDLILRPRLIVGADGPRSIVASWIHSRPAAVVASLQERHLLDRPLQSSLIFLDRRFRGGYGWLFPRGRVANVGLGCVPREGESLSTLLAAFVRELVDECFLLPETCVGRYGGLIPVAGPATRSASGRVILAGDAAGTCHPITGAGIAGAVETGKLAGAAGLKWLERPEDAVLADYDRQWKEALALPLEQGLERREYALAHWEEGDFADLARKTWVAFPEYYREASAARRAAKRAAKAKE